MVIFSQLMVVFAAVLVYPYFYKPSLINTQAANPPTVLSMSVTNITFNSATIIWKTDVPTTSQVQYSAGTSKFDLSSPLDTNLVTDHSVTITNLEPSINYSIRTISTDSAGRTTRIQDDYYALTLYDKTAPYDFALDNFHSSSHVAQGYSAFFSVRSRQLGGQSSPTIVYTTQNIPSGITITNVGDYYGTYVFKVTASSSIAPGNYSFQVTGTASGKTRTIILPLVVDAAPAAVTPLPYAYPAPAISQFDLWESNMKKYGTKMCNKTNIEAQGMWEGNVWYYDGIRVYYQMAEYLNEPIWGTTCAQYAKSVYRPYVLASNGGVPGWRVFTRGFLVDWQKTGDTDSSNAVNLLSKNAAYGNVRIGAVVHEALSREVAYAVNAKMDSETAGFAPNPLLADYATVAIGHLDQWFQTGNHERIAPFMYGLTAEALIAYEKKTGDLRVLPALQRGADYMWNNMWRGTGFCYQIFQDGASSCTTPAADLNMLIAPAYCWIYEKTGDPKYLTQSDQIFANGVLYAWLDQGKQFSQSYRLSFDYIACRQRLGAASSASSTSSSSSASVSSSSSSAASSISSSASSSFVSSVSSSVSSSSSISAFSSSSSSVLAGSVSSFSRSSLSSSSSRDEIVKRQKALEEYLAKVAAEKAAAGSASSLSRSRQLVFLKTPSELTSASGFLAKTINSAQVIFKDVFITDYFAPAVDILVDLNIVSGYNDANGKPLGLYRPSRDVQYAEVAKMLAQLMNLSGSTPVNASAQNTWAAPFVAALEAKSPSLYTKDLNVFTPMTRGQVIHAMADILGVQPDPRIGVFFSDTSDPLINTFKGMGIVKGNPDGTFRPNSPINRAEVATLLGRLLEQGYGS